MTASRHLAYLTALCATDVGLLGVGAALLRAQRQERRAARRAAAVAVPVGGTPALAMAGGAGTSRRERVISAESLLDQLNSATYEELRELGGIGPLEAAYVLAHRRFHGPFGSLSEVEDAAGVDLGLVPGTA